MQFERECGTKQGYLIKTDAIKRIDHLFDGIPARIQGCTWLSLYAMAIHIHCAGKEHAVADLKLERH